MKSGLDKNTRSNPQASDSSQSEPALEYVTDTEPDISAKTPPRVGRGLRRSNAIALIDVPSQAGKGKGTRNKALESEDYEPKIAEPEPDSGLDWEMIDETPKAKKLTKPKTRELIKAASEHDKALEHNLEDDMAVSTPLF